MLTKITNVRLIAPYDRFLKFIIPLIPERVKPNHITMVRLLGSPILISWMIAGKYNWSIILFVCLAFTDMLDGALARGRNQITEWGKLWDPIADKMLVGSVVVVLLMKVNLTLTILILTFELAFILGGTFQKMRTQDVDIKANTWGKIKMNLQCFASGFLLLGFMLQLAPLVFLSSILFYLAIFFAIMSLFTKGI